MANEGIAFGLFPGRQAAISILTVLALSAIAIALAGLVTRNATVAAGAGLLVGGSIGNLIDRLAHGAVTDFLDPARWPAFNLADIGIVTGAALIVLGLLQDGEAERSRPTTARCAPSPAPSAPAGAWTPCWARWRRWAAGPRPSA